MRTLELLAPAKNLECGIAAIDHGADAVYIGAMRFGARAAAGNSVDDIARLCIHAHRYGAKVYVTVNTIIYEHEMDDTLSLVRQLAAVGVDALLVQDMGLAELCRGIIPLHASTQCDTRSAAKAVWLKTQGMERVVLARELSAVEIKEIHDAVPDLQIEVFVHGALCVSYSGLCYASQYCFRRSANRGECAQFCRMKFDLVDADGKEIEHQRHLLSLKDLCMIDHLEELADAGACSFKIEGRLKNADYVKNVVAAYSQRLDRLIAKRPADYKRASQGKVELNFTPNLKKTFNRGFTTYFLNGRQDGIASFDTPKALGEYVGRVKEIRNGSFNVAGLASFANGDGLCFINSRHELEGFRINRAEGGRLFPLRMPTGLKPGMSLYRNNDVAFERLLSGNTAVRKLPVAMRLDKTPQGFCLRIDGEVMAEVCIGHQQAQKPQAANIQRQLAKLGNTPYICANIELGAGVEECFIPSSMLADLRRNAIEAYEMQHAANHTEVSSANDELAGTCAIEANTIAEPAAEGVTSSKLDWQPEYKKYPYTYNISNSKASAFYQSQGLVHQTKAFELAPVSGAVLMQCRHCLRYALGYCVRRGGVKPSWHEPLYLRLGDGRRFKLQFLCDECQMNVMAE